MPARYLMWTLSAAEEATTGAKSTAA